MTENTYREFHVVLQDEPNHVVDGGMCPCEPHCLLAADSFRVFFHNRGTIKFLRIEHQIKPVWWDAK